MILSNINAKEIAGILICLFGLYIIIYNWISVYLTYKKNKNCSPLPLIGAILVAWGVYILGVKHYWWVAFLIDYGTIILVYALPNLFLELYRISRFRLLEKYSGTKENAKYKLFLYKKNIFVINIKIEHDLSKPVNTPLLVERGMQGKWHREENSIVLSGYEGDRQTELVMQNGYYLTNEINYPADSKDTSDKLDGLELKHCS